jgi:hypothetical protein
VEDGVQHQPFPKNLWACQLFGLFGFFSKKKVVRNADSFIMAMMGEKKSELVENDPELFMFPTFATLGLLGAFCVQAQKSSTSFL